jgi:hypothetical protein
MNVIPFRLVSLQRNPRSDIPVFLLSIEKRDVSAALCAPATGNPDGSRHRQGSLTGTPIRRAPASA